MHLFLMTAKHEGNILRDYLKTKGIRQEDFAAQLGMAGRNDLVYQMRKDKLPDWFKEQISKLGVTAFDEMEKDNAEYKALYQSQVEENARLTKQIVELQAELIALLKAKKQ